MQQKRLDNILYVFQVEPYIITDDIEDVSYIYVEQDSLDGFKELNPDLKLTGWNYSMYSVFEPPYAKYINTDDLVMEFENTSINVSTYVDEDYSGTVQDVSYTPEDASVTFTYFLGDTSLNSSTFTLDSSGAYTITAKLDPNEIYDEQEASYSLIYQKEKRTADLSFTNSSISATVYAPDVYSQTVQSVNNLPAGQTVNYYKDGTLLNSSTVTLDSSGQHEIVAKLENSSIYNDASAAYTVDLAIENRTVSMTWAASTVTEYSGEEDETLTIDISTLNVAPYIPNEPIPASLNVSNYITYYLDDVSISGNTAEITIVDGSTDYVISARLENCPGVNDASCDITINVQGESSDYSKKYLTIKSLEDNNDITWTGRSSAVTRSIFVSADNGDTWTEKTVSINATVNLGTLNTGEKLLLKGYNTKYAAANQNLGSYFRSSKNFNLYGNIMSLIDGDNFRTLTSLNASNTYAFKELFMECTTLIDTSHLILPATTLNGANYCYQSMFKGCTSLTKAPELPATTLAIQCYDNMVSGCTSLTEAPELPATTLISNCYRGMFYGCTSLIEAPELPASNLINDCYYVMFGGCTHLNYIKSNNNNFGQMSNWTQNVSATGTFVLDYGDQNYWNTTGVVYGVNGIPTGWVVKDANGNTFTPKQKVNLTWAGSNLVNTVKQNSQFTWNYAVTPNDITNITYSISQDGGTTWYNLGNQPGSINPDTSTIGITNFKVKVEIVNDPKYVDTTQIFDGTTTVMENIDLDLSHYTRLDQIDPTLLQTSAVNFTDAVMDCSETLPDGSYLYTILKNLRTGVAKFNSNSIICRTTGYNIVINDRSAYFNRGTELISNPGFYAYQFSDFMQIWTVDQNVRQDKIYFKIPINGLRVYYNIADPTQEVTLFNGGGSSSSSSSESSSEPGGNLPTSMKVDGVSETPINTWRFSTAGEHIVEYEFANDMVLSNFCTNIDEVIKVVVGDNIVSIYADAFSSCTNLTTAIIGNNVLGINDQAFRGCSSLESIKILATTPPTMFNVNAFENTNNCPIYVPAGSVTAYQTATGWSTYASRIQAIP